MSNGLATSTLRVLVTGVGAPGTRGTLRCLADNPDDVKVEVVGVDLKADAIGQHFVDHFALVGSPSDPGYDDHLLALCERYEVDVVLPQTTREVEHLSTVAVPYRQRGITVAVADADAIRVANDKHAILQAFTAAGLPVPAHRLVHNVHELRSGAEALGYPDVDVTIKPLSSSGMRGFRVLGATPRTMRALLAERPEVARLTIDQLAEIAGDDAFPEPMLLAELLPGDEHSVDAFRGAGVTTVVPRRRRVIRSGISFDCEVVEHHDLIEQTAAGAEALGLTGAFGFQFKDDVAGRPRLLECNPRVQGTMVAAYWAGANVIWMAVRHALGAGVEAPAAIRWGTVFQRFWGGVGLRGGELLGEI